MEILFALGLGPRVVGVGDYVTWPPEAAGRPRLGGLFDPNLEAIVALRPDLAVVLPSEAELARHLGALGVEVLEVDSDSLADTEAAIADIAHRCGLDEAGRELVDSLRRELAPDPLPGTPRVLLSVEREPGHLEEVLSAGPGSFLDELLARLGAENVLADAPTPFPRVGLETVLGRRPEVIIELRSAPPGAEELAELQADWRAFPQLPAVRQDRLAVVAGSHTLLAGPRLPRLYAQLRAALATPSGGGSGATGSAAVPGDEDASPGGPPR